jgi:hypothetical protein
MLAVILKNTILVVLMICIGFFLIDNHLQEISNEIKYTSSHDGQKLDKKSRDSTQTKPNIIQNIIAECRNEDAELHTPVCEIPSTPEQESRSSNTCSTQDHMNRAMKLNIDDNMKEIYDYVYGDQDAPEQLTNMYDRQEVPSKDGLCSDSSEKVKFEKMCQNPIKDHHDNINYEFIQVEPTSNKSLLNIVEDAKIIST